ncbi:MAG TPA: hypothetical protein VI483_01475 [Candidatus Paceibacterota bacterium]
MGSRGARRNGVNDLYRLPSKSLFVIGMFALLFIVGVVHASSLLSTVVEYDSNALLAASSTLNGAMQPQLPVLDKQAYDKKIWELANNGILFASSTEIMASTTVKKPLWPTRAAHPNGGALLPFNRVVAYYGNFYSTRMGILGEFDEATVLQRLRETVRVWEKADPVTPVVPAIEYIAITAQLSPVDGTYRARMPHEQIDKAIAMAEKVDGIVILDLQIGLSTLEKELPLLEKYWNMPNVHPALDPEFSMKTGKRPGTVIGSFDAKDINYAASYLANLVRENNLPPKFLIIHRFTQPMVTNAKQIKPLPEVQVVMVMDGWGSPVRKIGTYQAFIYPEPVQFTGFKIFYKNDLRPPSTRLITPAELLKLSPKPIFVQYQ